MTISEAIRIARKNLFETNRMYLDERERKMLESSDEARAYNVLAELHRYV